MQNVTGSAFDVDVQLASLVEEVTRKLEAGERIDEADYARRCPSQFESLRKLLPALEALILAGRQGESLNRDETLSHEISATRDAQLGDFRLMRELGRGGMGVVYEAEQISLRRRVALKILPFAAVLDHRSLQRFRNEAMAAATLDHPHIVRIHSVGEERGIHYFAMQLVRGQTLADVIHQLRTERHPAPVERSFSKGTVALKSAPPFGSAEPRSQEQLRSSNLEPSTIDSANSAPPETKRDDEARIKTAVDSRHVAAFFRTAAKLGIQAADALQHAHDQGVLHRDIKPSNLMLDGEGQLYVTDFGLARIETDAGLTMTGDIIGTLRDMAPEQALATRVVIDHRADIYSLGATLYELITLQPAFGATDRSELLKQIAFEDPRPLRKIDRHIPVELETIVLKAMAKDPDERYKAAQLLADDLRSFLENRPIKAKPPTIRERAAKWSRRHVAIVWSVVAASFILATLFAGSTALVAEAWKKAQHSEETLQLEVLAERKNLYRANVQIAHQEWAEGQVSEADRHLDEFLPKPDQTDLRGWEWYYVKSLCHTEEKSDPGYLISDSRCSGSPFVFDRNGDSLVVRKLNSPEIALTLPAGTNRIKASADGRLLACIQGSWFSDRSVIEIWDLDMRARRSKIEFATGMAHVEWSPDGRKIATAQVTNEVNVWDAADGKKIVRLNGLEGIDVASLAWSPDGVSLAAGGNMSGVIAICEAKTGKLIRQFKAHDHQVTAIAFNPDGRRIASASMDHSIGIWSAETGVMERRLIGHNGPIRAIAWSRAGDRLASGCEDGVVKVWNATSGEILNTLIGHRNPVDVLSWATADQTLASSGEDGTKSWNVLKEQRFLSIPEYMQHAWLPTGRKLITWHPESDEGRLEQFELKTMALEKVVGNEQPSDVKTSGKIKEMDIDSAGHRLATINRTGLIEVWNMGTWKRTLRIEGHSGEGRCIAWSPDRTMLATGALGDNFKVWNAVTGEKIADLEAGRLKAAGSTAWSPDGTLLATLTFFGDVSLWDLKNWQMVRQMPHEVGRQWASPGSRGLAWSPTGDRLAARLGGWLVIWDVKSGRQSLVIRAHVANARCVAWSPDGARVATAGEDHTIKIWNANTGEDLLTLRGGDKHGVRSLSWSPDGRILASGGDTLKLWDATSAYER